MISYAKLLAIQALLFLVAALSFSAMAAPKLELVEANKILASRLPDIEEFRVIRTLAKRHGIQVWMIGETALAFAKYAQSPAPAKGLRETLQNFVAEHEKILLFTDGHGLNSFEFFRDLKQRYKYNHRFTLTTRWSLYRVRPNIREDKNLHSPMIEVTWSPERKPITAHDLYYLNQAEPTPHFDVDFIKFQLGMALATLSEAGQKKFPPVFTLNLAEALHDLDVKKLSAREQNEFYQIMKQIDELATDMKFNRGRAEQLYDMGFFSIYQKLEALLMEVQNLEMKPDLLQVDQIIKKASKKSLTQKCLRVLSGN